MHVPYTQIVAWLVPAAWLTLVLAAARGLPTLANLTLTLYNHTPTSTLTVIVPARNEQQGIGPCLESLLAQDYPIHIIAIDDRSDDATGQVIDRYLAFPNLRKLTIETLPDGWLGKTNAMAQAAQNAHTDYILFTDADILFHPQALRRAVAYAESVHADHLVLAPNLIIRHRSEQAIISLFQIFGLFAARPWKVADLAARDAIGIGAFNLVRTAAYRQLGGFASLRMEIVEDLALGRRVKHLGLRQRFAYGPGLVRLHWATGIRGIVGVMTKNTFAATNYHLTFILMGCAWLFTFFIAPLIFLFIPPFTLPGAATLLCILAAYTVFHRVSRASPLYALLAPFAAAVFIYTLLHSTFVTLRQGGVLWRGTFYPLAELRKNASPLNPGRPK